MTKYLIGTREAKWLLSASVDEYLSKTVYHRAIRLQTLESEIEGISRGEERTGIIQKQVEIKKWLQDQYDVLDSQFHQYLQLGH